MPNDTFTRAYLEIVFERLAGPHRTDIIARALLTISRWEDQPGVSSPHARWWRHLLSLPVAEARSIALADTELGRELRHATPFAGVLDPRERARLRAATAPPPA